LCELQKNNVTVMKLIDMIHLKALVFLYAFEESVDCALSSAFCDDSNLHISTFKFVLSTMGVMRNFTRYRFLIKNLLIDSLLTPNVESTYLT